MQVVGLYAQLVRAASTRLDDENKAKIRNQVAERSDFMHTEIHRYTEVRDQFEAALHRRPA